MQIDNKLAIYYRFYTHWSSFKADNLEMASVLCFIIAMGKEGRIIKRTEQVEHCSRVR